MDRSDGFNWKPNFGNISLTGEGDWKRRFILHFSFEDGVDAPALHRFHCDGGKLRMDRMKLFVAKKFIDDVPKLLTFHALAASNSAARCTIDGYSDKFAHLFRRCAMP